MWSAPFGLTLLDTVRLRKAIHILDIGCGSGFPMTELAERYGASCKIFGIDPAVTAIEQVKKKLISKEIRNAEVVQGNAEDLPFSDGFFGLIVSNNGLNNVGDEQRTLAECYRVAAAGCQMVLTMNLPFSLIEFYEIFQEILSDLKMSAEITKMNEHITEKRKPVEYWKDRIIESGFNITTINVDGFRMRFNDGTSFLNHSLIRNAFRPPWNEILPPDKTGLVFRLLEEKLNGKADAEGGLNMSVPYVCFDCRK